MGWAGCTGGRVEEVVSPAGAPGCRQVQLKAGGPACSGAGGEGILAQGWASC